MDQQPPVARVGSEFIFDLLPGTFNSTTTTQLTYSTSTLPSWLTFSTSGLTFYGTPKSSDIGQSNVTLTATDGSGSISSNFTLIVTNYSSPAVHASFATQISDPSVRDFASATALPGGTGISVPPYWSFSLGWAYDTFRVSRTDPINGELYFAAHERGTTGLPSWLTLDNNTFTFNGVAPANGTYTIVATGTDFWGYTGAQTSFVLEVGTGEGIEMAKGKNLTDLVTMAREKVDYEVDLSDVLVGGVAADASDLVLTVSDDYPWLSIDGQSIVGTTPDAYQNGTITSLFLPLSIASSNTSNTLSLTTYIAIDIEPYFFTTFALPNSTIDPSSFIAYDLGPYIANKTVSVNATVSPSDASDWLVFHTDNYTLTGTAPASPSYGSVEVVFAATKASLTASSTMTVTINGVTSAPTSSTTGAVPSEHSSHGLSRGGKIALGVVFGLLGLILLLLLLFCCCRKRKQATKHENDNDGDSFVAGSPTPDPFRRSNGLEPPRNLLGEIARVSGFQLGHSSDEKRHSVGTEATTAVASTDKPTRLDGLKGIFGWGAEEKPNPDQVTPQLPNHSGSFTGNGDVIGVGDPVDRPSQDASSFTQTFGSSGSSRASWESHPSFRWSSAENEDSNNRLSAVPSIPRPRPDFTPRYPRNQSPSALARLTSNRTLEQSPEFSEFGSQEEHSPSLSGSQPSGSLTGSSFPSGPSGLNRFGASGFRSIDEDDEDRSSVEGPAVVAMAERQSFETRTPTTTADQRPPGPRLRPSRERITSPRQAPNSTQHSRRALSLEADEGMFSDADEARRSQMYAPSAEDEDGDVNGLGYPASSIFGDTQRSSYQSSNNRDSTIRAIPSNDYPLSPPLPQVGSFIRHRKTASQTSRPTSGQMTGDGRVVACTNETFSTHPTINPPPTVSLSAATWSSAPPSTYRAETEGGGQLPKWLHFDSRELELWGVPPLASAGDVVVVRIMERMASNRRSDPMSFGYEPPQEREVGRIAIEVIDRMRSPQFALEHSPHAL
ncbi:hypothetical protein BCR39DRAFT_476392 [Naematelia encephala]|uniref:Dystroglycan-type cadherin-like domain-containing protein n=1 Tax=Naematelia encephala TaxID=71784 RepID=A0A1Y2BIX0_9TREE|nr:hypothetical protein BCR39DRAFT_476392 [Naematelia encephala]